VAVALTPISMAKVKTPNLTLAEKIQNRLIQENLIDPKDKEFISKLAEGKLKDNDWRTILLDRVHFKK
jgi:hypothetical protein